MKECPRLRSEEHTSELQSPFLISYAVFCLKKKTPCGELLLRGKQPHELKRGLASCLALGHTYLRFCPAHLAFCFFFNDTATTEIYTRKDTLSLHDALPISAYSAVSTNRPCFCQSANS